MEEKKKSTQAPTSHIAPFGVRMQPDLRLKIEDAAKKNGRSMNAEIVARLQESFSHQSLKTPNINANVYANDVNKIATDISDEVLRRFLLKMKKVYGISESDNITFEIKRSSGNKPKKEPNSSE